MTVEQSLCNPPPPQHALLGFQAELHHGWTSAELTAASAVDPLVMSKSLEAAKNLKLNEALPYAQKYATENLTPSKLQGRWSRWYENYR